MSSFDELAQDFETLSFLATSIRDRLSEFQSVLEKHPKFFHPAVKEMLLQIQIPPLSLRGGKEELHIEQLISHKKQTIDQLRTLYSMIAGFITSADWQSPSFDHSLFSEAGRRTGTIHGTYNDYQRDHHPDAEHYERSFRSEYIDAGLHFPVHVYATTSGMAAFSTIVASLKLHIGSTGTVLAGEGSYFENKFVLRQAFGDRVQFVNEMSTEEILMITKRDQPLVLFFDTLSNTESMSMPDLKTLIRRLGEVVDQPTYLVLDNTGLATSCQPLQNFPHFSKLRLIVMESLNKYHQFGFDRVTGGIMWTSGMVDTLFSSRMHLGTNIPQASVLALPPPNRTFLERRLARINRNTFFLAQALDQAIRSNPRSVLSHVVYPGLSSHPSYAWAKEQSFHGGYFVLSFKPEYQNVSRYLTFLNATIKKAKESQIDLNAGTSFGFDTTRIYLTARHANKDSKPFLRISPGTECQWEMEKIRDFFLKLIL